MSTENIALVRAVAAELRQPGPIQPGLRKRLNEVRVNLLELLASEEKREPSEYRQKRGPSERKRVPKDGGGYRFVMMPTLVTTEELLQGKLIRSTRYESIERLVQLVASCCNATPKASWNKQDCATAIVAECDFLEGLQKPKQQIAEVSTDEEIYNRVLNLFLEKWPSRESHSKLGKQMEATITEAKWQAYRRFAMRSATISEICWKHFGSKSKKEAAKTKQ